MADLEINPAHADRRRRGDSGSVVSFPSPGDDMDINICSIIFKKHGFTYCYETAEEVVSVERSSDVNCAWLKTRKEQMCMILKHTNRELWRDALDVAELAKSMDLNVSYLSTLFPRKTNQQLYIY
ncbi:MAG: hypothetical protein ACLTQG_30680 [Hungatella sp.]|uniref:hypothetical protein n=1 Tax=Hungatella sp. TaxID=2613924 RepID=UPI003993ED32